MFYGHLTSVTDARSTAVIVASGTRMISRNRMPLLTNPYSKGNDCSRQPHIGQHSIIWPSVKLQYLLSLSVQLLNLTYSLNGPQVTLRSHLEPYDKANPPSPPLLSPSVSLVLVPHLFRGFPNMVLFHFSLASLDGGCTLAN